jgi:hypothetical protein
MFGENWLAIEAVRERQANILDEHRKANSSKKSLSFKEYLRTGFIFSFTLR